jgi:hypothetical protein
VLVHTGVTLAFFPTDTARKSTDVQHAPDYLFVRTSPARADATVDIADVRAIKIKADTLRKILYGVFGKACIGT